jgi:cell division protein FtsX
MSNSEYIYCGARVAVGGAAAVLGVCTAVACGAFMHHVYNMVSPSMHARSLVIEYGAPPLALAGVSTAVAVIGAWYAYEGSIDAIGLAGY